MIHFLGAGDDSFDPELLEDPLLESLPFGEHLSRSMIFFFGVWES